MLITLRSQLETIQVEKVRLASRCSELQSAITSAQTEREKMSEQYSLLLQKETQEQKNIKLQVISSFYHINIFFLCNGVYIIYIFNYR